MPTKTKKAAVKNVKQLQQTHAKVETSQLTTIDQVWGYTENSLYGTVDEDEYARKVNAMTSTDLEAHAKAHGVWSVGYVLQANPPKLREALMNKFRNWVVSLKRPSPVANGPKPKISPEVQRILNEDR